MALLEGHASFVMERLGTEHVNESDRMRRGLQERRRSSRLERSFQRLIGFDRKISQYDTGQRFVAAVVERAGMEGLNRAWESEVHLPTGAEIAHPDEWLARTSL